MPVLPCGEEAPGDVTLCLTSRSTSVDLEQAEIVTVTTPEQSPFSSGSWIIWQMFKSQPRVSQMHLSSRDPSLHHVEKAKERKKKGETAKQVHCSLPMREHLEDWPLPSLRKGGLCIHDPNR